ncbi:MAG: endolytic transglycosylase MltG [Eggerthellaceae bacterium]|jgi:UPF0755 protein
MSPRRQITYSKRPNHAARSAHAKGDRQFRTYDTSAIRPKQSRAAQIISVVVIVAVIALVIWGVVSLVRGCSSSANLLSSDQTATVTVSEGEGASDIAKMLKDEGLVSSTTDFTKRVEQLGAGTSLLPGTYTIAGGTSVDDIIAALEAGPVQKTFTVPEGSTLAQTAAIVETATGGAVTAADFTAQASDASVYAGDYPFVAAAGTSSLEGFLFPKTYTIPDDPTADAIIRLMLNQFQTETASLDYTTAQSHNLSQYDVLKLASIIEKESDADHRATVSSVFYNRLDHNMRLQSDATVAYFVNHDPTADDLTIENPYNTYLNDGLTPTPINSPSLAALQAACAPESTNYLYFYFAPDSQGVMQYSFSETYEEHQSTYGG